MSNQAGMETQTTQSSRRPIRVWCDGCFDLTHWGHANAMRQARSMGDILVVGVHSDEEIKRHKGHYPVLREQERYAAIRAIKWVDEVVEDAPYVTQLDVLNEHNIDFCVHGEDITTDENGRDCYYDVKQAGRFRYIKRSEGVSTTELVGRMILHSKKHLMMKPMEQVDMAQVRRMSAASRDEASSVKSPWTAGVSHFLPSTRQIVQFGDVNKSPKPEDRIVYIDGAFDLFHAGHIEALRKAKALGDYLVVGIHTDADVNAAKGGNLPIMNLHERVLSVLSCRYVDEVVIGAPWVPTRAMLEKINVAVFAHGQVYDYPVNEGDRDIYEAPKQMGIFAEFASEHTDITTDSLLQRIVQNMDRFERRNRQKQQKELDYIAKHGMPQFAGADQEPTRKHIDLSGQ
ncbi:MAG: hypothetical protein MHM6MM_007503 [Cercozoa sp. M6MM]